VSPELAHLQELAASHGLAAVFVGTFLEGEAVLLMAGVLASRGVLSPVGVWITAAAGALCGHVVWFSLGRIFGLRLLRRWLPGVVRATTQARRVVETHPKTAIFVLQYLYGARIAGALALGLTRLDWLRFVLYEAVNCLAWAALFAGAGYALGETAMAAFGGWLRWLWLAASGIAVLAGVHWLTRRAARWAGSRVEHAVAEIRVERMAEDTFQVYVRDAGGTSAHRVTLSDADRRRLGGDADAEALVEASFRFLLEREPRESILAHFALPEIARYFPDFPAEIRRRLTTGRG